MAPAGRGIGRQGVGSLGRLFGAHANDGLFSGALELDIEVGAGHGREPLADPDHLFQGGSRAAKDEALLVSIPVFCEQPGSSASSAQLKDRAGDVSFPARVKEMVDRQQLGAGVTEAEDHRASAIGLPLRVVGNDPGLGLNVFAVRIDLFFQICGIALSSGQCGLNAAAAR